MSIDVPDRIKSETTECPHDFGCLATGHCGDREICKVAYSYGGNVLRLASTCHDVCPYRVFFGFSHLCTCPVRSYLHAVDHIGIA